MCSDTGAGYALSDWLWPGIGVKNMTKKIMSEQMLKIKKTIFRN